jgi:hypothetical protein
MGGLSPLIADGASRTIAAVSERLLLDERIQGDGGLARTYASFVDGKIIIDDDVSGRGVLPVAAVDRVMARYGLPLEDGVTPNGESLTFEDGHRLSRLRFHAQVDAEARDYLVWERPQAEPVAVLATHATAALRYLALPSKN